MIHSIHMHKFQTYQSRH